MLCFPVSQGGASLPPKAMHAQIKGDLGQEGPPFLAGEGMAPSLPSSIFPQERGLGEAGNSTVSHAGQAADPGGSWD